MIRSSAAAGPLGRRREKEPASRPGFTTEDRTALPDGLNQLFEHLPIHRQTPHIALKGTS
jgi:hypothetical protein